MKHGTKSNSFSVVLTEKLVVNSFLFGMGWNVHVKVKGIQRNCHCYSQKCKNCAINLIS